MSFKLINTGSVVEYVPVIGPDGKEATVSLQPGGKLSLGVGTSVSPKYTAEAHPKVYLNGAPMIVGAKQAEGA